MACLGEHAAELALLLSAFEKLLRATWMALTLPWHELLFWVQDPRVYEGGLW